MPFWLAMSMACSRLIVSVPADWARANGTGAAMAAAIRAAEMRFMGTPCFLLPF